MKFTKILKRIILEATKYETLLDVLTKPSKTKDGKKQPPKLSREVFNELVKADPTTRLNDVDLDTENKDEISKVKAGNYVQWLIKQYLTVPTEIEPGLAGYEKELKRNQEVFLEDLFKVTTDLMKFDRFKNRLPQDSRDINKLSTNQLYQLVKDFSLEKTKATKEEKKSAAETYEHPGAQIAFKGPNWTVVKISDTGKLGKDAACFYGGNMLESSKGETRWCTSAPGLNWFDRYIKDGPLYVVIPNNWTGKRGEVSNLPATRYQFHFQSNQFMDPDDRQIGLVDFLNSGMSELKEFFKPEFARGLSSNGGTKFVIDSLTSGSVGKFVSLYGVEDLFKNLPLELEEFQINNKDKNDIILKIPEEISKFKKLKMILLENCISEIPNSVCELENLRFFALINNPKLKTIPGCLVNLPKLIFINLKGSNNVEVPDEIRRVAQDQGDGMWDLEG